MIHGLGSDAIEAFPRVECEGLVLEAVMFVMTSSVCGYCGVLEKSHKYLIG